MKIHGITDALAWYVAHYRKTDRKFKMSKELIWYHIRQGNLVPAGHINRVVPYFTEKELRAGLRKGVGAFKNKGPKSRFL